MNKHWQSWFLSILLAGVFAQGATAAPTASHGTAKRAGSSQGRGGSGFASVLERTLELSPEQRDAVRGLLADQRQKSQTLREETDGKIRALLNATQQKKFDDLLAEQKVRRANRFARAS